MRSIAHRVGDGNTDPGEECDDGNLTSGDGCTMSCVLEVCGDGVVNNNGTEACEPPGTALWSDSCTIRAPLCGDGFLTSPEQCEDGNLLSGDGCTPACVSEYCGDEIVNDDGNEDCEPPGTASCADDCAIRPPLCGDGFVTPPEECDDGNLAVGDGCSSLCTLETLTDPDGGMPTPDGGMPTPDGGISDLDGGAPTEQDAGTDAPEPSTGGNITGGCSVRRHGSPIDAGMLLGLLGLVLARRRR